MYTDSPALFYNTCDVPTGYILYIHTDDLVLVWHTEKLAGRFSALLHMYAVAVLASSLFSLFDVSTTHKREKCCWAYQ